VLGAVSGGDLHQWQHKQWLTYPARELSQHAMVIGASGSGKTETLLRIAALVAQEYGGKKL
jgi:predicted NACHT family NTPase